MLLATAGLLKQLPISCWQGELSSVLTCGFSNEGKVEDENEKTPKLFVSVSTAASSALTAILRGLSTMMMSLRKGERILA
jgi:hypothetical protein